MGLNLCSSTSPGSNFRKWSFHPCGIGLSCVNRGRVPNWNMIWPSSGLSIQSFHSFSAQTPPAMTIATLSASPSARMTSRSALTRGYGFSGFKGSSALDRPLCPPASQGSS